jgi:16S rRNA (adenine(1408)-N(1))-methyltransferase
METIRGKTSQTLDLNGLDERLKNYPRVLLDLGTGDGRYVRFLAEQHPDWFIIGVDSCRENLHLSSRLDLPNALFIIASAQELPKELIGLVSHVTINFPWGSLLKSLLAGDAALMKGLSSIVQKNSHIDIALNGGALAEAGTSLETGTQMIYDNMNRCGWMIKNPCLLDHHALQNFPTSWAKRLAYGRDPRAMALSGKFVE